MAGPVNKQKFGTPEVEDFIKFADKLAVELAKHKADDGKIDAAEVAEAVKDSGSELIQAIWGGWNIPNELGELTAMQGKVLLSKLLPAVWKYVQLFVPSAMPAPKVAVLPEEVTAPVPEVIEAEVVVEEKPAESKPERVLKKDM